MHQKIFESIDSLYETYLDVWEDVCNIESPTSCKAGVDAVGRHFIRMADERGWRIDIGSQEVAGDTVCITLNPEVDAQPLALSGHMDTVHPIGLFGTPAVRRENGKIYGPGVDDCKGGIVAAFLAMDALDRCGYRARPIQLLLQSDEEHDLSGKTTIRWICEKARNAAAFLNLEGHTAGKVCITRKGIATFTFEVTGVEAHSSMCATQGANAIAEAAHKILELEKWKDDDGLTCNCGVISGGSVPNTVPGKCVFKANVRYATQEQLDWARKEMQRIADTVHVSGCSSTVTLTGSRVAMEYTARNEELVCQLNKAFAQAGLAQLEPVRRNGGSDAADVTMFGIPCVDSVGVTGGRIHSPEEYADMVSLKEAAYRIAAAAVYL